MKTMPEQLDDYITQCVMYLHIALKGQPNCVWTAISNLYGKWVIWL